MRFKGINNQFVEFRIKGYEFPESLGPSHEANWLLIDLSVKSEFEHWSVSDASLSTVHVEEMIEWFRDVAESDVIIPTLELGFDEPCVEVQCLQVKDDQAHIRIFFYSEFRPEQSDDARAYYVDLRLTSSELTNITQELQKELEPYPTRGFEP